MTYDEVVRISDSYLLPIIGELYGLEGYDIRPVRAHDGGRNVVYTCDNEDDPAQFARLMLHGELSANMSAILRLGQRSYIL